MNYSDFSNPKGGYKNKIYSNGYNTNSATTYLVTPKSNQVSKSNFKKLSPIYDGIEEYHTNHFIAYFENQQSNFNQEKLVLGFFKKFCKIFSMSNIAKVIDSKKEFANHPVFKFTIGGTIPNILNNIKGLIHDDWVQMQFSSDRKSFYGSTLKRNWHEPIDDIIFESIKTISVELATSSVEMNRKHFLAGRRSWGIGYDADNGLCYIETAALERCSDKMYSFLEDRQDIIDLWTNLLENYAEEYTIPYSDTNDPKYKTKLAKLKNYESINGISFISGSNEKFIDAVSTEWFSKVLKRHPGLITDL